MDVLTLLFEGEVLCEVATLMVSTEEEQRRGVVYLQRPQVQHTLPTRKQWQLVNGEEYITGQASRCKGETSGVI